MIKNQFEMFNDELNQCIDWYALPIGLQKLLIIVMTNAQRETVIRGFGNIFCTRTTFRKVECCWFLSVEIQLICVWFTFHILIFLFVFLFLIIRWSNQAFLILWRYVSWPRSMDKPGYVYELKQYIDVQNIRISLSLHVLVDYQHVRVYALCSPMRNMITLIRTVLAHWSCVFCGYHCLVQKRAATIAWDKLM